MTRTSPSSAAYPSSMPSDVRRDFEAEMSRRTSRSHRSGHSSHATSHIIPLYDTPPSSSYGGSQVTSRASSRAPSDITHDTITSLHAPTTELNTRRNGSRGSAPLSRYISYVDRNGFIHDYMPRNGEHVSTRETTSVPRSVSRGPATTSNFNTTSRVSSSRAPGALRRHVTSATSSGSQPSLRVVPIAITIAITTRVSRATTLSRIVTIITVVAAAVLIAIVIIIVANTGAAQITDTVPVWTATTTIHVITIARVVLNNDGMSNTSDRQQTTAQPRLYAQTASTGTKRR